MTKTELIDAVHGKMDGKLSKKDAAAFVDSVFEAMREAIKNDGRFSYPSFGTFTVKERQEREGRNPKTGESMKIAASKSVGFKPSAGLKGALN